uniref:rolling circle replication-associated protein n=5 Tax=Pseudomonadati TaxID=3379134 RepID=UPI0040472208
HDIVRSLTLPCGQCVGCRLERSRQWAVRCMHEASLYEQNCFITLTYNDENLPDDGSLHYDHFQKFMKRLRKAVSGRVRFYMAGEYGEQLGRPHFHACLFNYDFSDKVFFKRTGSGSNLYRSAKLESLWPYGYSSIGDVNFQSAAYVARYIMKKVNGKHQDEHYERVNDETGEITVRRPEFTKMSLKPGIGFDWYNEWKDDVYPDDFVVVNGKKVRPPRFYDKKFKVEHPEEFEVIEFQRECRARERFEENTDERLAVKEKVARARLQSLKRTLT